MYFYSAYNSKPFDTDIVENYKWKLELEGSQEK